MKDWSGRHLCFECAKKLGANINIGLKLKGRCHRCHSEQTLFRVTEIPAKPSAEEDVCPECAHPIGTHAASCRRSELAILRAEREEMVRLLEQVEEYDPEQSLVEQLGRILRRGQGPPRGDGRP
jgi:hypothetical protein